MRRQCTARKYFGVKVSWGRPLESAIIWRCIRARKHRGKHMDEDGNKWSDDET